MRILNFITTFIILNCDMTEGGKTSTLWNHTIAKIGMGPLAVNKPEDIF